ncbi:MAG TPA: hypothetical protein VHB20_16910 [Verrucomicrobiae bacterium]|jgi:hypothetical protein|nr:hypothetical protein [Verrucomicrobiae bacterium]
MKLIQSTLQPRRRQRGWALLVTMALAGAAMVTMTGVMKWSMESSALTARNNEYFATMYAAESATEKARSAITTDFQNYGAALVAVNMTNYLAMVPTSTDNPYWTNYHFSGGSVDSRLVITNTASSSSIVLGPPYTGLNMLGSTYEIIANAQNRSSMYQIQTTVGQQLNIGTIPLFQFAIFYQNAMEINPGAAMTVGGPVHGNDQIYAGIGGGGLTFSNDVSAVDNINLNQSPLDPTGGRSAANVTFDGFRLSNQNPLNLPVGTNMAGSTTNVAANVQAILQIPDSTQGPTTDVGTNMLYNKADLIVLVSNGVTVVKTGPTAPTPNAAVSSNDWSRFITTNTFYDQRQAIQIDAVSLNISNMNNWISTNSTLYSQLGNRTLQSIYVADMRGTSNTVVTNWTQTNYAAATTTTSYPSGNYLRPPHTNTQSVTTTTNPSPGTYIGTKTTSGSPVHYTYNAITGYTYTNFSTVAMSQTNYPDFAQPAVFLTNGAVLPSTGLSVVTPDPAYIAGNWNIQTNNGGTSDAGHNSTAHTRPSAIYADAMTILSPTFNPANSAASIGSRNAGSDTVNAAILTGNVPSDGNYYSGGVENFLRFLEDWSGDTLTYNGSLVCMFASQIATAPWPGTGTVYNPPTRNWSFDLNFNDPTKLPPLTPRATAVVRGRWATLAPQATSF